MVWEENLKFFLLLLRTKCHKVGLAIITVGPRHQPLLGAFVSLLPCIPLCLGWIKYPVSPIHTHDWLPFILVINRLFWEGGCRPFSYWDLDMDMDTVKVMNIETNKNTRTRMPRVMDMGIGIVPEFCSIKTDFRFIYKISKAIQHKKIGLTN